MFTENEVRKLLEEKRHVHDNLHHLVEKKTHQVAGLQLQLADLQKDGEGLGFLKIYIYYCGFVSINIYTSIYIIN